jgi:hypothetical protein
MTTADSYKIELLPLKQIRPVEEYSRPLAENLRSEISITGIWTHPLLVDTRKFALMDGHHRYHAALALKLETVPVILLSYDDPAVSLQSWRPGEVYTPEIVWEICDSGELLPMKSTRHIVSAQLPFSRVPLGQLKSIDHVGKTVLPAAPHPSRAQILSDDYHAFGARMGMRTISAAKLDVETASTIVPHPHLRRTLETDPAMAALLPGAPCFIALGQQEGFPFRLKSPDLLLLPPSLFANPAAMATAARWGMEAAFAQLAGPSTLTARRLAALARHGAALIEQLPHADRALLLGGMPDSIGAELIGSSLTKPSAKLLAWLAQRLGLVESPAADGEEAAALPLEGPAEQILISNGDSRIMVDPRSGKNKYGVPPRPRPEAVHFSSSTVSAISDYGLLFCDVLRRDLLNHILDAGHDTNATRADLSDAIIGELLDFCGLQNTEADGAIAASGTDTEVLAVLLARAAAPKQPLVNILISPEETGRGVKLAGAGRWFDELSATGADITKGEEIWPGAQIGLIDIDIRNKHGEGLALADLDAAFLTAGRAALDDGARVLAHVLAGSKTGLSGPSYTAIEELVALAPDRVDVVVDACQMRVDFNRLGDCVKRGWMVQVSGSKSLTGPPFSGGILFPTKLRERVEACKALMRPGIGYPEDWSAWWSARMDLSATQPAFGAAVRWLPALLEAKLLRHVPEALRAHVLERFRTEVTDRLTKGDTFQVLERERDDGETAHDLQFARHSIISFNVQVRQWDGTRAPLDEPNCRRIFELLNQDARKLLPDASPAVQSVLSQEFHIGQPVGLGRGANSRAVLRLVIGIRFFNIVGHAGPGAIAAALESEIADLMRAIDKLEILAENWWTFSEDIF